MRGDPLITMRLEGLDGRRERVACPDGVMLFLTRSSGRARVRVVAPFSNDGPDPDTCNSWLEMPVRLSKGEILHVFRKGLRTALFAPLDGRAVDPGYRDAVMARRHAARAGGVPFGRRRLR